MHLEKNAWMIIYGIGNSHPAQEILKSMKFAQKKLGINV